ncbi:hypothetical protein [Nocardioides donggukensis]|uniref:N-acetyltransferase domain-containing protein n=1 Tax=Nocardioides donggukensis TaxID=2774019 RepID=A0A927K7K7_9ACTN|nr:hypothetical protein [Nocardioides donggukensis]MBD8869140.1 hypothetical protein [Nocardioides donggukensis]
MTWLDLLGWGGSALLIFSLLQARVLRLRVLNSIASVLLTIFNAALGVWPMVAMNLALFVINLWFIVALLRDRHDEAAFEVLQVRPEDIYLRYVLRQHGADIRRFQPDFGGAVAGTTAYLVQKGDETVGVVVLESDGTTGRVLLDYVTPRFRDFSPGEFVWRRSGLLREQGLTRVETSPRMVDAYYDRLGFHREGDRYVLDL